VSGETAFHGITCLTVPLPEAEGESDWVAGILPAMEAGTFHCPSCGAAVSGDSVQCQYCQAMLQTVSCPACFGLMFLGSKFCPHCGAKADAKGAEEQPKRHCPRCEVDLKGVLVGSVQLGECPRCGGVWAEAGTFERICSDREAQTAVIGIALPPPVEAEQGVRYLKCPRCSNLMGRMNFAHRSGVIVDICRPHGVWFDRDELRRIIEFIRAGGLQRARQIEKEEIHRERAKLEAQQSMGLRGETLMSSNVEDRYAAAELLGGLGSVLRWLTKQRGGG